MALVEGMEKFSSPDNKTIKGKILDFINSQESGTNLDNFSGLGNGIMALMAPMKKSLKASLIPLPASAERIRKISLQRQPRQEKSSSNLQEM